MYTQLSKNEFIDTFISSNTYKNNFSFEGLNALFDYLEEWEQEMGEDVEFDMVGICCDYSEYENEKELKQNYLPMTKEQIEENAYVILEFKKLGNDYNSYIVGNF